VTFAGFLVHRGSSYERGRAHGVQFAGAVRANVTAFFEFAACRGTRPDALLEAASACSIPADRCEELEGIASGASVDFDSLLAYNLLREGVVGDDCTVLAAVGHAAEASGTILMKNSDQTGGPSLEGDGFHRHKEINVVVDISTTTGRRIVGIAAAGATGLKMGVNDAGVVAASNIVRTTELAERMADIVHLRGGDRSQVLRSGLEHPSCDSATRWACGVVMECPTDTPGNIEFADARRCFVIESSYRHWAVQEVTDEALCRTNRFELLEHLNDVRDKSSRVRGKRGNELLGARAGQLRPDEFVDFSRDHANGPGLNSICRHSQDPRDETSLAAMVVALHPTDPRATEVRVALGKPCRAWQDPGGAVVMKMSDPPETIAAALRSGEAWRRHYSEAVAE